MANKVDLTGKRFGRLVVLEQAEYHIDKKGRKIRMWKCKCDCGNETIVRHGGLQRGTTTSCGCFHKEIVGSLNRTHGLSANCGRLYPLWKSIKYRCYNKNSKSYSQYGGRGIAMCDEWKNDFLAFHDWAIANGYKEEKTDKGLNILTIDRIDVNGNYEPSNCRFVTNDVQAKNKRNTITDDERYRICPVCGKSFEIKQRSSTKTTCSRKCAGVLRTLNNSKDYTKIFPICGNSFNAKRGGHFNQAVYCSVKCKNISDSPIWEYNGESLHVVEWAEKIGINAHCLLHRKDMGWTIEEILTTPLRGKRNVKC